MKFTIRNLGKIRQADIELGDLTIVCGKNNLGKTYIAYSIYSFLDTIGFNLKINLNETDFGEIVKSGSCIIDLRNYWQSLEENLKKTVSLYSQNIGRFLALANVMPDFTFEGLQNQYKTFYHTGLLCTYAISETIQLVFRKHSRSYRLSCTLNNNGSSFPEQDTLRERLSFYFSKLINGHIFPEVHCMTGERSGICLFGSFLWNINSPLINEEYLKLTRGNKNKTFLYPKPLLDEIDMFRRLDVITGKQSMFANDSTDLSPVLKLFTKLAGGTYHCDHGVITYLPEDSEKPLSLPHVSSSVKSLAGLNFYIKHQAQSGDVLMIDEPELNLHPQNQRLMARLLARMVNAGIKVFITTHSDYIIREFNTLLQLKDENALIQKIKEKEGYLTSELLEATKVKAYVAKRKDDGVYLESAPISQENGMTIDTLDEVIDKMNQIHEAIVWGE